MMRRIALCAALAAAVSANAWASAPSPAVGAVTAQARERERDRAAALEDAEAARAEIAGLDAQLAEFDRAQAAGEQTVSGKRLRLAALTAQEAELRSRLGAQRAELARLLSVLELFRRNPPPALFVDPHSVKDAIRAAILIRAITPVLTARANGLKAEIAALRDTRRRALLASEDLFTTESAISDRRAAIETLVARKTALEQQAEAEAAQAAQDIATLNARAQALARSPNAGAGPPPPDPEHAGLFGRPKAFTPPVAGAPIRLYGAVEPGGRGRAQGWTWRTDARAAVVAPAEGVVEYAGPLKGWGMVVILRLGGGYDLVLAGLQSAEIPQGRTVRAGDVVGHMAADSADELYFEVRKNGTPTDPAPWLNSGLRPAA